jgi:hypothetical protein
MISNSNNIFLINIIYNLDYLILSDPISGLFPESYFYPVYMQYDMIWHANAGRPQKCWSSTECIWQFKLGPKSILVRKHRSSDLFKNSFIFSWVPISEERKINPRKPYLKIIWSGR